MKKSLWVIGLAVMLAAFSFGQAQQQSTAKGDQSSQLPPEQAVGRAPLILGYDVAPGEPEAVVNRNPTNASLGYKGVLMGNFAVGDAADELLVDFGSAGVWYYDNGAWTQQSGLNPEKMIALVTQSVASDEAIFDFGTTGLWFWLDVNNWIQLSGANATGMFAVDDDNDGRDEVQVDFGTLGIWRCDLDSYSWVQLSNVNPYLGLRADFWTAGYEEGVWALPTYGLWNIYMSGNTPAYTQLTGTVTSEDDMASACFITAGGAEDLVVDFVGLGTWLCKGTDNSWVQISSMSPYRIKDVVFAGGLDSELLFGDNAGTGLYWGNWNGSTFIWDLITTTAVGPGWCETCDWDGIAAGESEEVFIPINAGGMYRYDFDSGSLTSVLNTLYKVHFAVRGDPYGVGYDSTVALAMTTTSGGTPGLYLYDAAHGYQIISGLVPDGLY